MTNQETKTNTCERCEDNYEPYIVLIKDNLAEFSAHKSCEYDRLCKPCRMAVTNYGTYLTRTELEELEPKHEI